MEVARIIEEARQALSLTRPDFARLLGRDEEEIAAIETGDASLGAQLVEDIAVIFGLEPDEVIYDGIGERTSGVLMKSFVENGLPTFHDMVDYDLPAALGKFMRSVRRKAWLREAVGQRPAHPVLDEFTPRPIDDSARVPFAADALAEELRERLGLGLEPIADMLELVRRRLHIDVVVTTPDHLWADIVGASVRRPYPTILVNLVAGAQAWWRTRSTLAHELCHLLFDSTWLGADAYSGLIFSPASERKASADNVWRPLLPGAFQRYVRVEQRANAFAAYFLAPPSGVRALLGDTPAQTSATVFDLATHFGVHPITAVNVLTNVYRWSPTQRARLKRQTENRWHKPRNAAETQIATLDGNLMELVQRARELGCMNASMFEAWFGDGSADVATPLRLEGESPLASWRVASPEDVADTIRAYLSAGQNTPALRVVWDAVQDWLAVDARQQCHALLEQLTPDELDATLIVGLLSSTRRAGPDHGQRRAFLQASRDSLIARGRSEADVQRLIGVEAALDE